MVATISQRQAFQNACLVTVLLLYSIYLRNCRVYCYNRSVDLTTNKLKSLLKANDLSVTKQRMGIFNILLGRGPIAMQELIRLVDKKYDRASIYRTISLFNTLGITQRLKIGWKYKIELTDKFSDHHHHMACLKCGKVIDINEQLFEKLIDQMTAEHHFHAVQHQVEVQGICSVCAGAN